jgi:hypothetical protein
MSGHSSIVAARHGWWQACSELGLPGYDALDPDGANINLAIGVDAADPVSAAIRARSRSWPETLSVRQCSFDQAPALVTRIALRFRPSPHIPVSAWRAKRSNNLLGLTFRFTSDHAIDRCSSFRRKGRV